ncbi:pantoate kinase [Halopelagius inordinatus]|uniref:Pantoate kinase n=1 Tax=Halopelagius inordinatus TaxID=553467 RepID=A0A1I2MIS2_9EURY|nr:pantoate kinase [Halopelagius inordinatus]SFF90639.1 pantoate kinase [Halopelagius inordinatus]
MTDEATAFVPGHVTGFFSAHPNDDPASAGSRGAGVTLTDGVRVTVRRREDGARRDDHARRDDERRASRVTLNGDRVTVDPVESVLAEFGVRADRVEITAETPLPVGAGFGVSGAVALGLAFGVNDLLALGRSENELVTVAHRAEVNAGTGLGDVVAQARGGLPIRLEPGAPGRGALDGVPERPSVEYVTFGELSTAAVLSGDTRALTAAGESALADLREKPTASRMVALSRRFAREAGLLTDRVEDAVDDVRAAGGDASMAMLGETVFAFGTGLSDAGYDPSVCDVHTAGAGLVRED